MKNIRKTPGFTILEMAIALAIIGLIVGGIMVSTQMQRNSVLMTVVSDAQKFSKAAMLFRDKYGELPGDMSNATEFWGSDAGGCPTTAPNATVKQATCNGNGDGKITLLTSFSAAGTDAYEMLRAWQHMANARFIEGSFTGAQSSNTLFDRFEAGLNLPRSKTAERDGYLIHYVGNVPNTSGYSAGDYGHIVVFGQYIGNINGAIPPGDALFIDKKADDGIPITGIIRTHTNTACIADPIVDPRYDVAIEDPVCTLIITTGF